MLNNKKTRGFTLLELMVVVAIMSIMAAIALPSMRNFAANTRLVNRSEQIANLFRFAKNEAIRTNSPVLICGVKIRNDGRPTGSCASDQISNGMMAYADRNQDGVYDANTDVALRTISINDSNVGANADNRVNVAVDTCPFTANNCEKGKVSDNTFVFMPNGMFGFMTNAGKAGSYATLVGNSSLAANYVRFAVTDKGRANSPVRLVVITPSGAASVCNPDSTKNKRGAEQSAGDVAEVCVRALAS